MNYFAEDLDYSNECSHEPFWKAVYKKAFADYSWCQACPEAGEGQRRGVDRVVYLNTGKTLFVDEKKRRKDYGDILIEYKHVDKISEKVTPGWIEKPLLIDYLAYAFMPTKKVLLYDWQILKKVWGNNKRKWLNTVSYRTRPAENKNYHTHNLAIPFDVLHREVSRARVIVIQL